MNLKSVRWLLAILLSIVGSAQAASFDCTQARTKVERLICDTSELSTLDQEMATRYAELSRGKERVEAIRTSQRQWLKVRGNCQDEACIRLAYTSRLHELEVTAMPSSDPSTCVGDAKKVLDLAAAADRLVPDSVRETQHGRVNDGSLNFGADFIRPDIAALYARIHCWQAAREVIAKISREESREDSKANLSIEYAKAGYLAAATSLLESLPSKYAFAASAFGIAQVLVSIDKTEQAMDTIRRVAARDIHLGSSVYSLIRMLIDARRLPEAERIAAELGPSYNTHLILAEAYLASGEKKLAEEHIRGASAYIDDARSKDNESEEVEEGSLDSRQADGIHLALVGVFTAGNDSARAYLAAVTIKDDLMRLHALLALAEAQQRSGNADLSDKMYEEAAQIFHRIRGKGDESSAGSACSYISSSYARSGQITKAIAAVSKYCQGRVGEALAYKSIIEIAANSGDVDGCLDAQARIDMIWRNDANGPIAFALARRGDFGLALAKARGISNEFIKANAFRRIAGLTPSPAIIATWLENTQSFADGDMKAAAVQTLTAALARSGNSELAVNWTDRQTPGQVKVRGYLGVVQGLLGIVPGTGSPGD